MSISEYARHRGCSHTAVQAAVETERITRNADGTIDSEVADREWAANTDHSLARPGPKPPRERSSHREVPKVDRTRAAAVSVDELHPGLTFNNARAERERYEAKLKRLLFEQRQGNLLPRAEVEAATQKTFQVFREAMLNITNRIAAQLAAESDMLRVHELLDSEIRLALQEFVEVGGSVDVSEI